jgi:glucose uptake protein GlcU
VTGSADWIFIVGTVSGPIWYIGQNIVQCAFVTGSADWIFIVGTVSGPVWYIGQNIVQCAFVTGKRRRRRRSTITAIFCFLSCSWRRP